MAKTCSDCGNKFDLFWLGDDKLCRTCYVRRHDERLIELQSESAIRVPVGPTKQRSFAAANGLFDFLTVIAWIIIAIGLIAFLALLSQVRGIEQTVLAVVAGASFVASGLFFLALVQIGRATIYSAETNGEMLLLARKAEARASMSGSE